MILNVDFCFLVVVFSSGLPTYRPHSTQSKFLLSLKSVFLCMLVAAIFFLFYFYLSISYISFRFSYIVLLGNYTHENH